MRKLSFPITAIFVALFLIPYSSSTLHAQRQDDTDRFFEISKNLEIFSNLFKELNLLYVDPIEPGKMVKTGIDAMLEELDPYTNYYTEADAETFKFQMTGKYGGIGTSMNIIDSNVVISSPYQNGPVDKAGIKAGDIIVSIDGQTVKNKDLEDVGLLLKGAPGTSIKMVVRNPITHQESEKTVVREEIKISSVPFAGFMGKNKDVAYVYLSQFIQNSARDIQNSLDSLKKINGNLKGIVLDLRGNPGGLLDEAVKICNLFIPKGQLVVSTKGKNNEWSKEFRTESAPWDLKIPLVVLINHQSASASEIVSGTLQDMDRAVVMGTRSFGKGLVQNIVPLGFNTRLKVTTAKYYIPSGRCIQALDYSHRNEDGSVSKVPDSLMKTFYTKAGRPVKDGGGVLPDITIEEEEWSKIAISLLVNHHIFNYATRYYYENPSIGPAASFKISNSDFNDFRNYLEEQKFVYHSQNENILTELKERMLLEGTFENIRPQYEALFSKLRNAKEEDLLQNKQAISDLLSNEIVGRYYYQNGQVVNRLNMEDPTLKEAIELINKPSSIEKILKK